MTVVSVVCSHAITVRDLVAAQLLIDRELDGLTVLFIQRIVMYILAMRSVAFVLS